MGTLSEEYRQVLKATHAAAGERGWGHTGSGKFYPQILAFLDRHKVTEFLDYGAGAGGLKKRLSEDRPNVVVHEFEPARDDACAPPEPCDFVVCNDVFEHVEPEHLEEFLDDLVRVVSKVAYITIALMPATRILSDGRNAHLIVERLDWWLPKIVERFDVRLVRHPSRNSYNAELIVEKKMTREEFYNQWYRQWEKP